MTKAAMRNTVVITKERQNAQSAMPNSPSSPSDLSLTECREFDIRITSDGTWHYRGSPIGRAALVRLFASVLKRDAAGDYWLETPAERGRIQVDDAPFVAVDVTIEGADRSQRLNFRTNVDDRITADAAHPIYLRPSRTDRTLQDSQSNSALRPYLLLDNKIEALIARSVYYRLVDVAVEYPVGGTLQLGVWSGGEFFPLSSDREYASRGAE